MTSPPAATPRELPWAGLLVVAVGVVLGLRLLRLIDLHAVNLLYWDQFALYEAFKGDPSAWEVFRWQHGPHRQGVPFLLTWALAGLTHWNTRADAFLVGAFVLAATAAALWLRVRLFGRLRLGDVAIPLLLLTPAQYGIFIHTPNASHGAGPLFLLLLYALAFTLRGRTARLVALLVLDFLLIHTGFGVFVGALTPLIFAVVARHDAREGGLRAARAPLVALALALAAAGLFFVGYTTERGLDLVPPAEAPAWAYPAYVALMFAHGVGLDGVTEAYAVTGGIVALGVLALALAAFARLLRPPRPPPRTFVLFTLTSFSLLYAATTAYGRVHWGLSGAQSSRYVPLIAPALLALYLAAASLRRPRWRVALVTLAAGVALFAYPMRERHERFMQHLSRGKRVWVETYLETGSIETANERAGLVIYWRPRPESHFPEKLDYLREHRLSFFADVP